jgi:hypothetical protein
MDKVIEYSERGSGDSGPSDRLGTAMKLWAIGFGAEAEKSAVESKQAFLNDVDRFQQSKFWQYQVRGWLRANRIWPTRERALNNYLKL